MSIERDTAQPDMLRPWQSIQDNAARIIETSKVNPELAHQILRDTVSILVTVGYLANRENGLI